MSYSLTSLSSWEMDEADNRPPPVHVPRRQTTMRIIADLVVAVPRRTLDMIPHWGNRKRPQHLEGGITKRDVVSALTAGVLSSLLTLAAIGFVHYDVGGAMIDGVGHMFSKLPQAAALLPFDRDDTEEQATPVVTEDLREDLPAQVAEPTIPWPAPKARSKKQRRKARKTKGELSARDIVKGVRAGSPRLGACLRRARANGEIGPGQYNFVVNFTVQPDAKVTQPQLVSPVSVIRTSLPMCFATQLRKLEFPKSSSPSRVRNFPIPVNVP